jgi:hypothetical protein
MGRYLRLSNSVCGAGTKDMATGFSGFPMALLISEKERLMAISSAGYWKFRTLLREHQSRAKLTLRA